MKKGVLIALLSCLVAFNSYSQQGELSVGLGGGYSTLYKNGLYGLSVDYNLTDHLQISLSEMINPSITVDGGTIKSYKQGIYATNLDIRFYLIHMREWGTGPAIGGQYLYETDGRSGYESDHRAGFNIGWMGFGNLTDQLKLTVGWRWTSLGDNESNHFFYAGLSYIFELY